MCGIAGVLAFDGAKIDPKWVIDMAHTLKHRGPDGEGAVFFNAQGHASRLDHLAYDRLGAEASQAVVALAHRRLSIIDLTERGAQPMRDPTGCCWITFNGEIYNYVELGDELSQLGHRFVSTSDTEVVLHAYLEWGIDAIRRFNGMFAFAIWDARVQRLVCARDHLGIKPFYFCRTANHFWFASEQKAIVATLPEKPKPNVAAMADFLAFSYVPSSETMFSGLRRLPPGSWLIVDSSGVRQGCFWDPSFAPQPGHTELESIEELRHLLHDSIRMQIRSDVPVGAHLSGGIDSSTVTCLAAARLPRITTFTARFSEGGFFDETPYARLVAERVGADYREIVPRRTDLADLLPRILYHLDEPVESASVFGKFHVAEIVSQSVKVVLGGQGGDELFGGYDWYVKNAFTALCYGAGTTLGNTPVLPFMWATIKSEGTKRLVKSLWNNIGEKRVDRVFYRNWSRLTDPALSSLLNPAVCNGAINSEQRFLTAFHALGEPRAADGMFKFDMRYYLDSLLTSEDRLSMAFSVESRVPLLDYRIAELAGRLGFEQKATPGLSKRLLRLAVADIVPQEILARRDKRGFPTPIGAWLRDPSLNLMERFVFNDNPFAERYFVLDQVRQLYNSRTLLSSDWSERLWRILNVCVWGQVFKLA